MHGRPRHILGATLAGACAFALCLGVDQAALAAAIRVSAEAPLSPERLGDAIRSYVEAAEVTVVPATDAPALQDDAGPGPGVVAVLLRYRHGDEGDPEVVVRDHEDTLFARLTGTMRSEDLYRAAALKVQALLQRRVAMQMTSEPLPLAGGLTSTMDRAPRDRLLLDLGMALMLPSSGLAREGVRLGLAASFARRWQLGLGAYLEPTQSSHAQEIRVSTWELPMWLALGIAWHRGAWLGRLDAVGHLAVRRISADAPGIVSNSDTALSPRAGAALGVAFPLGPDLRLEARVSALAVLADTRYHVDGQVVEPASRMLVLAELGILYGLR
jgi:hypothetical protein